MKFDENKEMFIGISWIVCKCKKYHTMKKELTLKETQQASFKILKEIKELCEKLGLKYVLAWGTLLGAIRHHGFIPWDDDVDIMMPRPDHDKLVEYMLEHKEEAAHLQVFNSNTCAGYPYMLTRISDPRYILHTDNEKDFGLGIFVDIYVEDGAGNSKEEALSIMNKTHGLCSLIFLSTRKHYVFGLTKSWLKRIIKVPAFIYTHIMGKKYFEHKLMKYVKAADYENSSWVANICWGTHPNNEVYPKAKLFEDTIDADFEDTKFKIPKQYDSVLRQVYGDYMQLPPKKDRIAHHFYSVYWKKDLNK